MYSSRETISHLKTGGSVLLPSRIKKFVQVLSASKYAQELELVAHLTITSLKFVVFPHILTPDLEKGSLREDKQNWSAENQPIVEKCTEFRCDLLIELCEQTRMI